MNAEINSTVSLLESGGLILYPTDTIWGIGCDALNEVAIRKIYRLKQREESKSMIILLPQAKDVFRYVANPHPDIINIIDSFDKPTTVIYDQAVGLPDALIGADGSIAIRVTRDPFCKSLLKRFKKPLVSTSANISGHPSPRYFDEITAEVKAGVDYIVQHRQQETTVLPPSKIVRILADGTLAVIRK